MEGKGQGADAFKAALTKKIGKCVDPGSELRSSLSANANAMMSINICGEMNKLEMGEISQFEKDVYRSGPYFLKNGDTEIKLDKKFETARDQLAQFITGDDKATFNTLTKPEDKKKVLLMMAMLSQETEKAVEMGSENALAPREDGLAFTMGGDKSRPSSRIYHIEKLKDGGISLHYTMDKAINQISTDDLPDYVDIGAGSSFQCEMDYTLTGEEFNRLAKLDYKQYDDKATQKLLSTKITMHDGTRKFPDHYFEKVADSIPNGFKFEAECTMKLNMILLPSEDEELLISANDLRLSQKN